MIYFDNSATSGTKPDCVINAVKTALTHLSANPGRSGHSLALKTGMLVYAARKNTADLVGCEPERVLFSSGCTAALNTAIFGSVVPGGNVITTAYEHNSVLRPLFELQRMGKITVTVLRPNEKGVVTSDMVAKTITNRTYMVAICHVSNVTGAITPVAEIGRLCRNRKLLLLVDGAQSVGYSEINMPDQNIDMLAFAPHKGLHAPQGVGVLCLAPTVKLRPLLFGGTGTASESVYQPEELPEALEAGTLPTPAIAGLNAAIRWNNDIRQEGMMRLREVSAYALENLKKIDGVTVYTAPDSYNGMLSFNIKDLGSMDVCNILSDQYDIATRGGLHCAPLIHRHLDTLQQGIVRASLSFENTFAETDALLRAVREIAN